MRSIVALGVVSLAVAASMVACGDDSSDDRPGIGGTGGTSGGSGGGGTGGGTGGGGAGGTGGGNGGTSGGGTGGGGGGAGGAAPALATCTGCVELVVPVTGPNDNGGATNLNDQVGYQFSFATPADFSDGVVTWRIAAVEPNANYFINLYAQNGAPGYAGIFPRYTLLGAPQFVANTFVDLVLDISAYASIAGDAGTPAPAADAGDAGGPIDPGTFDKSAVAALGIQVGAAATLTGNAIVRVAVDSVNITGVTGQANRTFTTTAEGLAINQYQVPTGTREPVVHP